MSICEIHKHENGYLVEWCVEYEDKRPRYNKKGDLVIFEPYTQYRTHTAVFTDSKTMLGKVKQLAEGKE